MRPRLRRAHGPRPWSVSPTLRWRAQVIVRVIAALQTFLPVSHIVILSPRQISGPVDATPTVSLRERLINAYGQVTADGTRVAMCAYCGTTIGRIEIDHLFPKNRGGTDGLSNRVLACTACNAQKGDRTPEEAGMPLQVQRHRIQSRPNRAGVHPQQTARLLVHDLCQRGITVNWPADANDSWEDIFTSFASITGTLKSWPASIPIVVAWPIARPVKQIYSSRNYPLSTPLHTGLIPVGTKIKRRIQVNQALLIAEHPQRKIEVVPVDMAIPNDSRQIIRLGMLCEGRRNEKTIVGIVAAIHSTGRLTLLVPSTVCANNITWRRVVVSPRLYLRVLSTDRVIFVRTSPLAKGANGLMTENDSEV